MKKPRQYRGALLGGPSGTRPHSAGPELLPRQHSCQVKILLQNATGIFHPRYPFGVS